MNNSEKSVYEKLAKLSKCQLNSIDRRLEKSTGRWSNFLFLYRNSKIKSMLQKLWKDKGGAAESAENIIMADLDIIQSDDVMWPGFTEIEVDYIRLIFHGMHDVLEEEESQSDSAKTAPAPTSVSVAMPSMNK